MSTHLNTQQPDSGRSAVRVFGLIALFILAIVAAWFLVNLFMPPPPGVR